MDLHDPPRAVSAHALSHADFDVAVRIERFGRHVELRRGALHQIEIAVFVEQLQFHAFEFHHRRRPDLAKALGPHRNLRAVLVALRVDPVIGAAVDAGSERSGRRRRILGQSLLALDIRLANEGDDR